MKLKNIVNFTNIFPFLSHIQCRGENIIILSPKNLIFTLNVLKQHINYQYKLLSCISGVDFLNLKYRFGVVYDLLSLSYNTRLRLKVLVNETTPVSSIVSLYRNADWWEREVWDLYGIYFNNHPDLRRILTDYGFEGYPMRKDFPLSGYIEARYDQNKKRVVFEPIQLSQELRAFTFEMSLGYH